MKAKRFGFTEGQDTVRVRVAHVQGLRSSSAASPQEHGQRRVGSRRSAKTAAITASVRGH